MTDGSPIEWLHGRPGFKGASWNPTEGCTRKSPGCVHCYAEKMAARFSDRGMWGHGLAERVKLPGGGTDYRWTGVVRLNPDKLTMPLRWRDPRTVFVNSTSDLFHEKLTYDEIVVVAAIIALSRRHVMISLTKRSDRQREFSQRMAALTPQQRAQEYAHALEHVDLPRGVGLSQLDVTWPLPNWWMGVSVESKPYLTRLDDLMATPAAIRTASFEPLLEDLGDLTPWLNPDYPLECALPQFADRFVGAKLDQAIAGFESGHGARIFPGMPKAVRSIRDQCAKHGTAFYFKQWGEYMPDDPAADHTSMVRVGKGNSGALLDGREHKEFPA